MAAVITRTQYLEVNSVPLATPAFRVLDLTPLYGLVARGTVETLPYVDGGVGYPHRVTLKSVTLPLLVMGGRTFENTPIGDPLGGLDDNVDYLMTNVIEPALEGADAVWHRLTGDTREARVFVGSFEARRWGRTSIEFGLELVIESGRFVAP